MTPRTRRPDDPVGPGRASAGLIEIDYEILRALPVEGTQLVEHVPLAPRARVITERVGKGKIRTNSIAGRLMALNLMGYALPVTVMPVSGGYGWQRTQAGDELLREHDAANNGRPGYPEEVKTDE